MAKTIENLFIYGATYTAIIPIWLFFSAAITNPKEWLFKILITYSTSECITNLIGIYSINSNLIITSYSFFTIAEYLLFTSCLYILIKNLYVKKLIKIISIFFIFFSCIYFFLSKTKTLDSLPIGIETIIILSFAFIYLYEQMEEKSQVLVYNLYPFWIVAGIMIYLAGSFFIYIFANAVDTQTRHLYWMFTNLFTILKNIFFSISFFVYSHIARERKNKSKSSQPYLN